MKDLEEVVDKVKSVEDGVTSLMIPILKDSIKDGNQHNKRLFVINMMLILAIIIIVITAIVVFKLQQDKYVEFLSQYEFKSETSIYQETTDNSNINSGIKYIK